MTTDEPSTQAPPFTGKPITMPGPLTAAHIRTMADRFDRKYDSSVRRRLFGGERRAEAALVTHGPAIDRVVASLAEDNIHVDPALLRAVLRVEADYNPPVPGHRERTISPMNVNFAAWRSVLEPFGIRSEAALMDPETNIRAAAIILARFDALLVHQPGETPEIRVAQIASLYGNTTAARRDGILMYGAKVAQFYTEIVGSAVARAPIAEPAVEPPAPPASLPKTTRGTPGPAVNPPR